MSIHESACTLMFTVINLMSSVSREALVCFMCVICGLVIKTIRKKKQEIIWLKKKSCKMTDFSLLPVIPPEVHRYFLKNTDLGMERHNIGNVALWNGDIKQWEEKIKACLLYTSPEVSVASNLSFSQGLGIKSVAPALMARTALSVSA